MAVNQHRDMRIMVGAITCTPSSELQLPLVYTLCVCVRTYVQANIVGGCERRVPKINTGLYDAGDLLLAALFDVITDQRTMQTHCILAQILAFLSHTVEVNTLYAVSYCCQLIYLQNSQHLSIILQCCAHLEH